MAWNILYSFSSDSIVRRWVKGDSGDPRFFHGKSLDLLECPGGTPLETDSMDVLVNADGGFSSYCLPDYRMTLLFSPPLFFRAVHLGSGRKGRTQGIVGEGKHHRPRASGSYGNFLVIILLVPALYFTA